MNTGLLKLKLFIRDLLSEPESLIKSGRTNEVRDLFSKNFIVVDAIAPAARIGTGKTYDGDAEQQNIAARFRVPCTINFYGLSAYDNATRFTLLKSSQLSLELQKEHDVSIYNVSTMTDAKALAGQQYGNNVELSLNIEYNESVDLSVLRIDEAQIETLTENGQEQ